MTTWKCIFLLNLLAGSCNKIVLLTKESGHQGLIHMKFCHCGKFCKHFNFPYIPVFIFENGIVLQIHSSEVLLGERKDGFLI